MCNVHAVFKKATQVLNLTCLLQMDSVRGGFGNLALQENEVASKGLDLFDQMTKEISVKERSTHVIAPISYNTGYEKHYEFFLPSRVNKYLDLSKTRLYVRSRVLKASGEKLTEQDVVAICNMYSPALFKDLSVHINDHAVSGLTDENLHYKAYLQTLLSYGDDARHTHLASSQYYLDTPGAYDTIHDSNSGFARRRSICAKSQSIEGYFPLNSDLFSCERLFPPEHSLRVKLTRSSDNFTLIFNNKNDDGSEGTSYKVHIEAIKLHTKYVDLQDQIHANITKALMKAPLILPFTKTEVILSAQKSGITSLDLQQHITGNVPKTLLVTFVNTEAAAGNIPERNPFHFPHYKCSSMKCKFNSKAVPDEPYVMDLEKARCMREYRELFDNLGIMADNVGNALTFKRWKEGNFMLAFNENPDSCYHHHIHPGVTGAVDIHMTWESVLEENISVMTVATYDTALVLSNGNWNLVYL